MHLSCSYIDSVPLFCRRGSTEVAFWKSAEFETFFLYIHGISRNATEFRTQNSEKKYAEFWKKYGYFITCTCT
jgi:hypothetical protein